jgi:integrase
VTSFLSSLAVDGRVAASTQNQALSALLFLYRDVLEADLPWLDGVVRAKLPERLPVILTRDEVIAILRRLDGAPRLMASLLYGAGLRLLECCRLRVQDIDLATNQMSKNPYAPARSGHSLTCNGRSSSTRTYARSGRKPSKTARSRVRSSAPCIFCYTESGRSRSTLPERGPISSSRNPLATSSQLNGTLTDSC